METAILKSLFENSNLSIIRNTLMIVIIRVVFQITGILLFILGISLFFGIFSDYFINFFVNNNYENTTAYGGFEIHRIIELKKITGIICISLSLISLLIVTLTNMIIRRNALIIEMYDAIEDAEVNE